MIAYFDAYSSLAGRVIWAQILTPKPYSQATFKAEIKKLTQITLL